MQGWDHISSQASHQDVWDPISSAAIFVSETATVFAGALQSEVERIKSALNCQDPERATLSAERLAVEHALAEVHSLLPSSCQAPDSSQLNQDELVVDTVFDNDPRNLEEILESPIADAQCIRKETPPSVEPVQVDLLDLSENHVISDTKEETKVSSSNALSSAKQHSIEVDLLDLSYQEPEGEVRGLAILGGG